MDQITKKYPDNEEYAKIGVRQCNGATLLRQRQERRQHECEDDCRRDYADQAKQIDGSAPDNRTLCQTYFLGRDVESSVETVECDPDVA